MRFELLPGMNNVVRFPVERRAPATLGLLREIAPDVREVLSLAEAFDLNVPVSDLRARVDRETAEHIVNTIVGGPGLSAALDELLDPTVTRAVEACREAHDVSVLAAEAQQVLLAARTAKHFWLDPLRERAPRRARLRYRPSRRRSRRAGGPDRLGQACREPATDRSAAAWVASSAGHRRSRMGRSSSTTQTSQWIS